MKKNEKYSLYYEAIKAVHEAVKHREAMLDNFNNCEPEFFDIANSELTIANMNLEICLKKARMLEE